MLELGTQGQTLSLSLSLSLSLNTRTPATLIFANFDIWGFFSCAISKFPNSTLLNLSVISEILRGRAISISIVTNIFQVLLQYYYFNC